MSIAAASNSASFADLTIFCDFDGPIVDVSDRYYSTYRLGLADVESLYAAQGTTLPIHLLSKAQFWQMKRDRTPDREIAMRSGLQGEQIDRFLHGVNQIVNQPFLGQHDRLQPGVRWALSLLKAQGAKLVLVTLRCQSEIVQLLPHYELAELFDEVWGSADSWAAYQNHAEHKTQLLSQALVNNAASKMWMIGDTEADVLAGQAMKIPTIALSCGIRSTSYLKRFSPTNLHADLLSAVHALICHLSVPDCSEAIGA